MAKAACVTKDDLDRIKKSTVIETREEKIQKKKIADEQVGQQMAKANARKQRMAQNDKTRASKIPATQQETITQDRSANLLSKAQMQLDEEQDDVKHMNQMVLYSKVVTIRDKQLEENKRLEGEWCVEQKKLDMMMEIERLKNLKEQDEREKRRKEAVKRGQWVIVEQIKDREVQRLKDEEAREKEKIQMLKNIEKLKEEDAKMVEAKKARVQIMMEEVGVANKQAITLKEEATEREREREAEIIAYNKLKIQREEEKAAELRRIREEKEKEVQRLRDLQEKAADRQSEIDELRAKRAFEERERAAREAERQGLLKKERVKAEMEEARQKQFRETDARLAEQARAEREEFLRVIQKQKEEEQHEKELNEQKLASLKTHQTTLIGQMGKNEGIRK